MGEYLPFLFAIAYVIYGFYNNLKKAQEEAKKRNPSRPWDADQQEGKRETPRNKPVPQMPAPPVYAEPEPILVKEVYQPERWEPKYEPVYQEPAYQEYVKPKAPARKKKSVIPTNVSISDRINPEEGSPAYQFDMRDAVIKKAILDRPQY